jgi:hypothetical protein
MKNVRPWQYFEDIIPLSIKTFSTTTLSIKTLIIKTLSIMTLSIMTLSMMMYSITTFSIMIFSIITFSKMTLSIMTFTMTTLSITPLRGQFVEQMLTLSLSFRCDQIYKYERYDFGHTLLCCLSRTWMFNKLASA